MSVNHGKRVAAGLVAFAGVVLAYNLVPMVAAHWVSAIVAAISAYWQLPADEPRV